MNYNLTLHVQLIVRTRRDIIWIFNKRNVTIRLNTGPDKEII